MSQWLKVQRKNREERRQAKLPSANDWHFNDRSEVDISSMRQLVTDAPKTRPRSLTALQKHAERKDVKPIYTANYGPIIGKAFYYGKSGVQSVFSTRKKSDEACKTFRVASEKNQRLHIWLPLMRWVTADKYLTSNFNGAAPGPFAGTPAPTDVVIPVGAGVPAKGATRCI